MILQDFFFRDTTLGFLIIWKFERVTVNRGMLWSVTLWSYWHFGTNLLWPYYHFSCNGWKKIPSLHYSFTPSPLSLGLGCQGVRALARTPFDFLIFHRWMSASKLWMHWWRWYIQKCGLWWRWDIRSCMPQHNQL